MARTIKSTHVSNNQINDIAWQFWSCFHNRKCCVSFFVFHFSFLQPLQNTTLMFIAMVCGVIADTSSRLAKVLLSVCGVFVELQHTLEQFFCNFQLSFCQLEFPTFLQINCQELTHLPALRNIKRLDSTMHYQKIRNATIVRERYFGEP